MDRIAKVFNGIYTVQNTESKEHRTFRIRTQSEDATFAPNKRDVSLLVGPDNTSNYKGFAFIDDNGIHVWRKYHGQGKRSPHDWYADMLWKLLTGQVMEYAKYTVLIEGHCIKCNRLLTEPESIRTGIGPVCAGRVAGAMRGALAWKDATADFGEDGVQP